MNDKDEIPFKAEQTNSAIHIPLLLPEVQQEKNDQFEPYIHYGFLPEDSSWLGSTESNFLYDAFYPPYGINSGISLQANEMDFGLSQPLQHPYELGSPFSYYSTNNDRIMPTQQMESNSEGEGPDNSFPSAFNGWSPICNPFQVHPTGEPQSTETLSSSFEHFPYASTESPETASEKNFNKLKYSDVLVKPPSPRLNDSDNVLGNTFPVQEKCFSNCYKSPRKKRKENNQSIRGRSKQYQWLENESDHLKYTDFCDKPQELDAKDEDYDLRNCDSFQEWCSVSCLSNDCSDFSCGLEEITLAKQNKDISKRSSSEPSGKKSSESLSKSPTKIRKETKASSDSSSTHPGQKSDFQWTSFVLNNDKANNLQSSSKTQNPKRTLHINNNLGTSWQSDFDKVKNIKVSSDEAKSPTNDIPKKTCFSESCGTKLNQRNSNRNISGCKLEKSTKDIPRKTYGKKKKESKPILDLGRTNRLTEVVSSYLQSWGMVILSLLGWLFHLITDVSVMSLKLSGQMLQKAWLWVQENGLTLLQHGKHFFKKMLKKLGISKLFNKFGLTKSTAKLEFQREENISLPVTGEEAMKRLLACKGKDPYSILGVTPSASDDDIKKYYRRQAVLVHPDKNRIPGAEEAFKTLAHAFELIGEPEKRKEYHSKMMEESQLDNAWHEFTDLLNKLHEKMEEAANTIKCTNCNNRHKRIKTERPCYCARYCATCKINHAAREGDIWAESSIFGFLWHYYACMDSAVFDITEWAACQTNNLKHLQANTHNVQYRIVSGHKTKPPTSSTKIPSEPEFEDFLSSFFHGKTVNDGSNGSGMKSKSDYNKKKRNKKKK